MEEVLPRLSFATYLFYERIQNRALTNRLNPDSVISDSHAVFAQNQKGATSKQSCQCSF